MTMPSGACPYHTGTGYIWDDGSPLTSGLAHYGLSYCLILQNNVLLEHRVAYSCRHYLCLLL